MWWNKPRWEKCPKFNSVHSLEEEVKNIQIEDAKQTESLKSLHARMDEEGVVRKETHDAVIKNNLLLETYIAGEDAIKSQKKKNNKVLFWIISAIVTVFLSVSGWLILTVINNSIDKNTTQKNVGSIKKSIKKLTKVVAKQAEHRKEIKEEVGNLKNMVNRNYGFIKGSGNATDS